MFSDVYNKEVVQPEVRSIEIEKYSQLVADIAQAHKAINLRILDVSPHCDYAAVFILMSASSNRQAKALADALIDHKSVHVSGIEGYANGEWILLDLGHIIVHIFHETARAYYQFDKLWGHASLFNGQKPPTKRKKASSARSSL